MVVISVFLICDCGSMDITIDDITEQYYHCNDCGNEWPVIISIVAKKVMSHD